MYSLAAPAASHFFVDKTKPYPFAQIVGREHEEGELRSWLVGAATGSVLSPLGGAALVTGFRGVGKTSLVNKVLFDVGLRMLHGAQFLDTAPLAHGKTLWGPFDEALLPGSVTDRPKKNPDRIVLIPVNVEIARPITAEALLHRIVRRTYFTLVNYRVGDLDPGLIARARAAYLRSLGESSLETVDRIKSSFGIDLKLLEGGLDLTSDLELEFARTARQVVARLSVEEAEEELLDVFAGVGEGRLGAQLALSKRVGEGIASRIETLVKSLRSLVKDDAGVRVHVVLVIDELDKLEQRSGELEEVARLEFSGGPIASVVHDETQSVLHSLASGGRVMQRVASDGLGTAVDVIRVLKTLFSSRHLSAITVAGWRLEDDWLEEQHHLDPLLRSLFARHVYVPCATPKQIAPMIAAAAPEIADAGTAADGGPAAPASAQADSANTKSEHLAEYVALRTRGRYKDVIRVVQELGRDHHAQLRERFGPRLVGWGSFEAASIPAAGTDVNAMLDKAETLEDLVRALSGGLPPSRANVFGVDYIRAVIAKGALTHLYAVASFDDQALKAAIDAEAKEHGGRIVVGFLKAALHRIAAWTAPPAEGHVAAVTGKIDA